MGNCIYCGENAGIFKSKHNTCETNYHSGISAIVNNIRSAITKTSDFQSLENDIRAIAGQYYIKSSELVKLYTKGFNDAVQTVLDEGILTAEEENNFEKFTSYFDIDKRLADQNNSLKKAAVLRGVIEGKIPECNLKIKGYFPFRLLKSEVYIWIFNNINFYEQHTGIDWRINPEDYTHRIYYKTGSFKGYPVHLENMKHVCQGTLTLTNKQIYFSSPFKNYAIPYNKIEAINSYEDAVGLVVDKMSATPQVFKDLDGWFIYNLVDNLRSDVSRQVNC